MNAKEFDVKDSGERQSFASGMVRDVTKDKIDYLLVRDGPMFERWARHLDKGAQKYSKRNWMKASGREEYERFRESAARHFEQWLAGKEDEDHAAAVIFNINGCEYVKAREREQSETSLREESTQFFKEIETKRRGGWSDEYDLRQRVEGAMGVLGLTDLQREEEGGRTSESQDAVPRRPTIAIPISDASPGVVDREGLAGSGPRC